MPRPAFMSARPTARPKTNLLKSRRSAHAGYRAVRDSTLVAWYRSFYAPRAGGAHDSHHRTTKILGHPRRRGGRVAARGEGAAAGDASDRTEALARSRRRATMAVPPETTNRRNCNPSAGPIG